MIRPAQAYAPGHADAPALVLGEPLSLWGGIDVETGRIIDRSHADLDRNVAGTILVMPGGRHRQRCWPKPSVEAPRQPR